MNPSARFTNASSPRDPYCANISSTRPVMSTVGGSSIALWSANGMFWNTIFVLSLSNDAQPPALHCIALIHVSARWQVL